jgi:cytochrome c-type biogenesis protein CcmH
MVLLALMLCFQFSPAYAVVETYQFNSEIERKRYQSFIEELRCPKCQNQNLSGSNSPIAADLRRELHRMIEEGQTDTQIVDFMVARYGEFVLYRPRWSAKTAILWLAPAAFLLIGLISAGLVVRKHKSHQSVSSGLTNAEQEALKRLLKDD